MTDIKDENEDFQGRQVKDFAIIPGAYKRIHEPHNDGVWDGQDA